MDLITYALLKRQIAECETNIKAFIPHIGDNGNWYLGETDTGKPSRGDKGDKGDTGETGATGAAGAAGKSAYAYAQDGGYTGTEEQFAAKLAEETYSKSEIDSALGAYITDIDTLIGGVS